MELSKIFGMERADERQDRVLKIFRVVPLLHFGGVERRVKLTIIGFKSIKECSVQTVVLGYGGQVAQELAAAGFAPLILNENIKIPNFRLIFRLVKIFKSQKPDVVHTSGAEANFHGLIAAWLAGVTVRIGEEIGFPNHDLKWRIIFRWVYKLCSKVIAISCAVKNNIVELGEVLVDKVEVVYNPVQLHCNDTELTRHYIESNKGNRFEKSGFVFVTTCRLVEVKNLKRLVNVFAELVNKYETLELKLWIVGEGPEGEKLHRLANEVSVAERVFFYGFQRDVTPFLLGADVFVIPSFSEGFSISLVEAMLCGLPCVVTNRGGTSEIVVDNKTGFLIDPLVPKELFEKMEYLLSADKATRQRIGLAAKESAKRYSVENYLKRLMEVYRS